ncbi:hypothetical protein LMG7974_00614 [Campylobacter majalis]|uniref:Anti-sigma-28 factor FlgM C-terminal domain-containing protein n=1 Tax=Campylobacter majalis TaxID=2790656 RepID=A0ABM8Q4B9_9BACT|nr:flagellar biosynthesis anti-sigma factor FlgM [Campylobacter majalis]CAD7287733.1 hypothetical protein LMG7974_00614 [Campylobacter majalis]
MISSVNISSGLNPSLSNKNLVKKEPIAQQSEMVKNDKISEIAKQINEGSYELDMKKTARAILDTLV